MLIDGKTKQKIFKTCISKGSIFQKVTYPNLLIYEINMLKTPWKKDNCNDQAHERYKNLKR